MRIVFYQHQYPAFGGIETVTTRLANQFADDGHQVLILSFKENPGTDLLASLKDCVEWRKLPSENLEDARNTDEMTQLFETWRPDVVILQDSYAPIEDVLFAAIDRCSKQPPVIVVEHSVPQKPKCGGIEVKKGVLGFLKSLIVIGLHWHFQKKRLRYERRRRMSLYNRAARYVVLSPKYITAANELAGVERCEKVSAIPNPIPSIESEADVGCKRREVLFCGSLLKLKGVHRILRVWSKVEPITKGWHLKIAGDGPERGNLEALARKLKLERCEFIGFAKNPTEYYRSAAVLVMASDFEGWPMVLGESMIRGCVPVVYDSFAAASDIIANEVSGLIIPPFKENLFVQALGQLLKDEERIEAMSKRSISAARGFSMKSVAKQWYDLLEQIIVRADN